MIFLVAAFLTAQAASDQPITAVVHAPHSIMPAIESYVDCLNRAELRLSQAAGPLHANAWRGLVEQARVECAGVRLWARANALKEIEADASVIASQREETVDAALGNVDESDDMFLRELERREKAGDYK